MVDGPGIELRDISGRVDDDHIVVTVTIFNPQQRTLYAYGSPRRIAYDPDSRTMTVALHDEHIDPDHPLAPHLPQPRFVQLEGNTETDVEIVLPAISRRIRSADERAGGGPMIEEQPLVEAENAEIEMAYQDAPFYYNPRLDKAVQLRQWAGDIARLRAPLRLTRRQPPQSD